jgi:hypothetical protein
VQRAWRIPRTVARVRKVSVVACGVDVAVDVDSADIEDPAPAIRTVRKTLRLCFLSADHKLDPVLRTSELPPQ